MTDASEGLQSGSSDVADAGASSAAQATAPKPEPSGAATASGAGASPQISPAAAGSVAAASFDDPAPAASHSLDEIDTDRESSFDHRVDFEAAELGGGLSLGPLELHYEEIFAEVLEDGVITQEERTRLDKAATNMGLDPQRLWRLEQAMIANYELRHRVRVVSHFQEPAKSIVAVPVDARDDRKSDPERKLLLSRIEELEQRVQELEKELAAAQTQVSVEVDVSTMTPAVDGSDDPETWLTRVRHDPTSAEAFHALYRLYGERDALDRQWCVAQALVVLGDASDEEQACYDRHGGSALLAPRSGISQAAWTGLLFHPEEDLLTGHILGMITPAVLLGRVSSLRRDKQLHQPPADTKANPATSTVTAVRALGWAASILGLGMPGCFVEKARDAGYEHIPGIPPFSVVGRRVLSGRSQRDLAFSAGRHLAWYRQEHFVCTLFPGVADLEDLFLAALVIGSPSLPIPTDVRRRVEPVARAIEPVLEPEHVDALRGYFMSFVEAGGRTNLQRWTSAAEKTACRAGLLLCNDLGVASKLLEAEEGRLGPLAKDLLVFSTSERYSNLRKQLGVAVGQTSTH